MFTERERGLLAVVFDLSPPRASGPALAAQLLDFIEGMAEEPPINGPALVERLRQLSPVEAIQLIASISYGRSPGDTQ